MTSRVLIVEDMISFRELIATYLRHNGYNVVEASSVEAARRVIPLVRPDMILLDLHLADGEGLTILRDDNGCDAPIIVVSGRADAASRVESLELGAADFMVKPVDLRELLLRRRRAERPLARSAEPGVIEISGARVDLDRRLLERPCGAAIALTEAECRLARLLLTAEGRVVSRDVIARRVLGRPDDASSRAVDALVSKLRRKLDPSGRATAIWSVRGKGFRFAQDEQPAPVRERIERR
jgi:DNA-binding response OmpR family regulator